MRYKELLLKKKIIDCCGGTGDVVFFVSDDKLLEFLRVFSGKTIKVAKKADLEIINYLFGVVEGKRCDIRLTKPQLKRLKHICKELMAEEQGDNSR